ncbi:DUF4331 domain-containing protein [Dokdonia sinensis]|uniref:DUF4331 domain-containing protein n=1 Tax=Dokdonia sinensis TaxID=2479847 RepID=A0A3M0GJB8_9FLAO|nr:DUF4331 family protein [Dokdonia sinensis]RMB62722.1 DUF4331 domain-containing protein [Dokdonia sinensis]
MKKSSLLLAVGGMLAIGAALIAADHLDAPAVGGTTADITDVFAFEGANPDNTVFVANVQGLLAPGSDATFDENVLIEINIDNTGDLVEDLVIQAIPRNGQMYFFGPVAPGTTGLSGEIVSNAITQGQVEITTGNSAPIVASTNGVSYFAGPREDPFYFDFNTFNGVVGNSDDMTGPNGGFKTAANAENPFAGTNVLSIVVEVPNSLLGGTFDHPAGTGVQVFNTWTTANRKQ